MKKIFLTLGLIFVLVGQNIAIAQMPYHDFPPTPAFRYIGTPNEQISAKNYYYPLNVTGAGCINVIGANSTHTMTISGTGCGSFSRQGTYNTTQANNVNINVGGSRINFINGTNGIVNVVNSPSKNQVNVTVGSTVPTAITSINSQTGPAITIKGVHGTTITSSANIITVNSSTYQNNTGSNLGTSGTGIFSSMSGSVLQFLKLITKYPLSLSSNSTNVIISFIAKFDNGTCSGSNNFFKSFDNVTGTFVCGQVTGFLTNAILSINGNTNAAQTIAQGQGITVTDSGATHTIATNFKVNNSTCSAGQFQNGFSNKTGNPTCATPSGSSGGVTQLNNQTGEISLLFHSNATQITNSSNKITLTLKPDVFLTNGSAQNVTKLTTFNARAMIHGLLLNYTGRITGTYTAKSTDDLILVNASSANVTITLPGISTSGNGKIYTVKKIDYSKNYVEIIPTSSSIDDFPNANLTNPLDVLSVENNSTIWSILTHPVFTITNDPLKYGTNAWYGSWVNQGTPTTVSLSNNTIYAVPFTVTRPMLISKIESEITTIGTGSNCRMALYTDSGAGYPLNKVHNSDVGALTTQTTALRTIINNFTSNIQLPVGNYYNTIDCNDGSTMGSPQSITFDTSNNCTTDGATTCTITVGSNSNRLLIAVLDAGRTIGGAYVPATSVKIGTLAFTHVTSKEGDGGSFAHFEDIWYVTQNAGLGTGSQTVTVVWNNAPTYSVISLISLYNVDQSTPVLNSVTAGGAATTPISLSVTPVNTGSWIVATAGSQEGCTVPNHTGVYTQVGNSGGDFDVCAQYYTTPTINAGNTMSWTSVASGTFSYSATGFEVKASLGSVAGVTPSVRAIPVGSLSSFLGMPQTMGSTNGGTMYQAGGVVMGSSVSPLPDPFPTNATIKTSVVPEILVNVKG